MAEILIGLSEDNAINVEMVSQLGTDARSSSGEVPIPQSVGGSDSNPQFPSGSWMYMEMVAKEICLDDWELLDLVGHHSATGTGDVGWR